MKLWESKVPAQERSARSRSSVEIRGGRRQTDRSSGRKKNISFKFNMIRRHHSRSLVPVLLLTF